MVVVAVSLAIRDTALTGTARAREMIDSAGGAITGAQQLSSWAISFVVEIPGQNLSHLMDLLTNDGAIWLENTDNRLRARASELAETSDDVILLMHVEFINAEPERRIKVPAVPG